MEYTGDDNQRHRPVMIHRAILGTLERFSAVLIEHYGGAFPLWLAPEQLRLVPVADRHVPNCEELAVTARASGLRVHVDETKETVGKKIRAAQLMKSPYVVVVGDRDLEAGTFTVRDRSGEEHQGVPFDRIVSTLAEEARTRCDRTEHILGRDGTALEPWRMEYIQAVKDEPAMRVRALPDPRRRGVRARARSSRSWATSCSTGIRTIRVT